MELPHSSTDIRIATACQICNGNGGFGSRTREGGNPHQPCTSCEGTGWKLLRLQEIPATLAQKIRDKLPADL